MASLGFEGFEKRLELVFLLPTCGGERARHGLRLLPVAALREALEAVQCAVVSAAGNASFDAYVLSESSLFVYPSRVILKTCGTTRLLRAVPVLLRAAGELGLGLRSCRYSRGSYLFPEAQPFPHADFDDEVRYLDGAVPSGLHFRRSSVLQPSPQSTHKWHVYSASTSSDGATGHEHVDGATHFTVEVCMTELDRTLARQFYLTPADARSSHAIGDEMTALSGLGGVNPQSLVFGYAFAPCGYSMNALDGARYATVHVTPEDGHSYASYEYAGGGADALASIGRAVAVFRPSVVSASVCYATTAGSQAVDATSVWSAVANALEPLGLACRSQAAEGFPGAVTVTYQTFTA
ncbi:S-adenosylmethionine decarboxylase proenzyme 4 [Phragmites australis]|uniref:S-adenosylmethionine decarboxylase proenzyme 4 n=1 Tax=Phragmites australis TaxID=29695 RepID=UPI002D76EA27|nr:S-adenosylmethionine decarboxylase proenzyme 4 [Phragmites australis]